MAGAVVTPHGHGGSVDVHIDGPLAVVTLRRGQNHINLELIEAFQQALDQVERDPSVRVMVTTGEGKFYSNGLDLDWVKSEVKQDKLTFQARFIPAFSNLICRILTFPVPTIAAVNGHAFAGGAILCLAHDYTVMQTGRGWWCLNEVHVNLRFPPIPYQLVKTKLSPSQITHAAVLGQRYTAEEAKHAGIVVEVAPPGELLNVTRKFASRFLTAPAPINRESLQNMKEDIYSSVLDEKNSLTGGLLASL